MNGFPGSEQLLICDDVNFPKTDCETLVGSCEFEQKFVDFFEESLCEQTVDFNSPGETLLVIALHRNCSVNAELNEHVTKIYNCSDQGAVSLLVDCPHGDAKSITENFQSFGNADHTRKKEVMLTKHFEATCHSNINQMSEKLFQ